MFRASTLKKIALCSALVTMAACSNGSDNGSDSDINTGTGTGNAQTDTQTTNDEVTGTTQVGIQQAVGAAAQLKFATIEQQSVACTGGGTATVTGDVTSGSPTTFDLEFDFTGCTVLDGVVNVVGTIDITGTSYEYSYEIDGEVGGNGCLVSYEGYLISVSIPEFSNPLSFELLLDGILAGECSGGSTSCDYDNISITNGVVSGAPACS